MPFAVKDLYRRASMCRCPETRSLLLKCAWDARKQWLSDLRTRAHMLRIDSGKAVQKKRRLHKIRTISSIRSDGSFNCLAQDDFSASHVAAATFGDRWGAADLHVRESALDFMHAAEKQLPDLSPMDFIVAFHKLKRWDQLDIDGVCITLLWFAFCADPDVFTLWMRRCVAHRSAVQALRARCKAVGKKSKDSLDTDLRAIVPMAACLRLLDRVLGLKIDAELSKLLPCIPGFFVGAQRHTQCLDIAHGAALFIEKALDSRSEGSVAQADIRCYFDSMPILRILKWLVQQGVDMALVAAVGRHQLLTSVLVFSGQQSCQVRARSRGGLTGSNLALLLSRIPVESAFSNLNDALSTCSYRLDCGSLKAAVYVDNIYTISRYASSTTMQMELVLSFLRDEWGLATKAQSKRLLIVKGADNDGLVGTDWVVEECS